MSNIFTLEKFDEDFTEKINIDDLYEKKKQSDMNKLVLFNKILNRVHVRIKTTSRQKKDEQFCWFVVPEIIIGVPKYDQASCIAYLVDKLKDNGFNIRYIHPNTLFISWLHWVPSYVRTEIKKKTGIQIDEFGKRIEENTTEKEENQNRLLLTNTFLNSETLKNSQSLKNNKNYTPIQSYKPLGNLIYNHDLISKMENKFTDT
jgi:hypothetical protein